AFRDSIDLARMIPRSIRFAAAACAFAPVALVFSVSCGPESVSKGGPPVSTATTPQAAAGARDTIRVHTMRDSSAKRDTIAARTDTTVRISASAAATTPAHFAPPLTPRVHRTSQDSV